MSYFNNPSSGNNPLAFPSYNQQNLQQRNISGLGPINNSVTQLQNQYNDSNLNATLHQGEEQTTARTGFINTEGDVSGAQGGTIGDVGAERQQNLREGENLEKPNLKRDRRNRPGQKFGAKKRSWVWTWFVQDVHDQNVAVCDFCGKVITRVASDRGSPKKLSEHLHTHKLTKNSINTARSVPIDGNGMSFGNTSLQIPYTGPFSQQAGSRSTDNPNTTISQSQLGLTSSSQQAQQAQHSSQSSQSSQSVQSVQQKSLSASQSQKPQMIQHQTNTESIAPELKQNTAKYRRTNAMTGFPSDTQQIHPQLQNHMAQQATPNSNASLQYNRRYISSNFENSPYSGSKFHRHLLKFLAENKLSIRLLKSHSFQQLIYDLRPDSINDLLDLTGLYTSFVEVARVENLSDPSDNRDASIAEANVVNTLAQELIKK